jgi:hypothetical protein
MSDTQREAGPAPAARVVSFWEMQDERKRFCSTSNDETTAAILPIRQPSEHFSFSSVHWPV